MKILLLEDDGELSAHLQKRLQALQCEVVAVATLGQASRSVESGSCEIYIIDRLVPDGDGESWLAGRRLLEDTTPAIFLTALGSVANKVSGLRFADDYLVKPFEFDELWARVQSLVRRMGAAALDNDNSQRIRLGALIINRVEHTVRKGMEPVSLKPMEYRLLECLATHAGQTVTRKMLLEEVWGFRFDPSTNIVETYISRLRAKIDDDTGPSMIETVRGEGYRIVVRQ